MGCSANGRRRRRRRRRGGGGGGRRRISYITVICKLTFITKGLKKSYTNTKFHRDPFRNFRVNIHRRTKSHDLPVTCSFAHFVCKESAFVSCVLKYLGSAENGMAGKRFTFQTVFRRAEFSKAET